jgi:hypothetical protein
MNEFHLILSLVVSISLAVWVSSGRLFSVLDKICETIDPSQELSRPKPRYRVYPDSIIIKVPKWEITYVCGVRIKAGSLVDLAKISGVPYSYRRKKVNGYYIFSKYYGHTETVGKLSD